MQTSEKQQEQQRELHTKLWAIANDLRGKMEANEFKNYILGLIFYRYQDFGKWYADNYDVVKILKVITSDK